MKTDKSWTWDARLDDQSHQSKAENDPINSPAHYKAEGGMEVIEVVEAFRLGFNLGNVAKYILRAGKKGDTIEDLKKALWYLEREISTKTDSSGVSNTDDSEGPDQ